MRFKDAQEQLAYVREASEKGNLELVYAALDVLGSTAWKINKPVFDVVLKVWNTGERILKIPPAVFDQPEPVKPHNYDIDPQARAAYLPNLKKWTRQKADAHSDRCSVNYKMEIARAVRKFHSSKDFFRLESFMVSLLVIQFTSRIMLTSVVEHTQFLRT